MRNIKFYSCFMSMVDGRMPFGTLFITIAAMDYGPSTQTKILSTIDHLGNKKATIAMQLWLFYF